MRYSKKLRAPKSNGAWLIASSAPAKNPLQTNQAWSQHFSETHAELGELRRQAKSELLLAAQQYSAQFIDNNSLNLSSDRPFILSGHQPEFFHPGVWFKNFLLSRLARQMSAAPINLIIDNDECSDAHISMPAGTLASPHRETVEFDSLMEPLPFENRPRLDPTVLSQFVTTIQSNMAALSDHAMIIEALPGLEDVDKPTSLLGEWVAQIRYQLEIEQGLENLEVPLSQVCQGRAFCTFAAGILRDAERFQTTYNRSLLDFRQRNKLRSQTHPAPNLIKTGDWIELPFWLWSVASPQRGPLYAQRLQNEIEISDLDQLNFKLAINDLADEIQSLQEQRVAIRPRALMTTMYARLFLSDLFVHGIGGAKYDELTDALVREYFGAEPPLFLTATSTHHLPFPLLPFDENWARDIRQELRTRRFSPEKFLNQESLAETTRQGLIDKQQLLAEIPARGQKRGWHTKMEAVNQSLWEVSRTDYEERRSELVSLEKKRRHTELLLSREYSFLLHPPSLCGDLMRIAGQAAKEFD